MSEPPSQDCVAPADDGGALAPGRLIASTLVAIALLMAVVAVIGLAFREPLLRLSHAFVDELGGPGVMVGFYLPDAFTIPLPNDVFTVLGLKGGLPFGEVCAWATGGSLAGGSTGYWIGKSLRQTRWVRRVFERRGGTVQATMDRYGVVAVAVAAITPLPYSVFCWAAGAARVSFRSFFLASQLRILRVAGYLYLIQLGLVSVGV